MTFASFGIASSSFLDPHTQSILAATLAW